MLSKIKHAALGFAFKRRGPWVTRFVIDGESYGGAFDPTPPSDVRVPTFAREFLAARRILEMGSLEGGHTFQLARLPGVERVVAVEGRDYNVKRATFVQRLLEIENVEFLVANLESIDLGSLGDFDAVFCAGLLYHLPEPWKLLERIRRVSPNLFLSTHYAAEASADPSATKRADTTINGLRGYVYSEGGYVDPLSGLSPTSFWPTLASLRDMLRASGFARVDITKNTPDRPNGPAVDLAARAS